MRTATEVTAAKLRGGFYTPARLVDHTLGRLRQLVPAGVPLRILEPGVGDGAFIDGLARQPIAVRRLIALDIDVQATAEASRRLQSHRMPGEVRSESTVSWSLRTGEKFDAVVGNLPFVRFQFVSASDSIAATQHAQRLGIQIGGVSNLWLPMLLASLTRLVHGGAFALIMPAECFTGVSAGNARRWLLQHTRDLRCDLYPPGSYPDVLQEVVLLSGRIAETSMEDKHRIEVALHKSQYSADAFDDTNACLTTHYVRADGEPWTKLLLSASQLDAYREASSIASAVQLSTVAKFEVAAVTGANAFFSLRWSEVDRYDLHQWARPLLARSNHAPGLHFTEHDFQANIIDDRISHLFDAGSDRIDRDEHRGVDEYLTQGEQRLLHQRYKCRIREPWYAVPYIKHSPLMLSKRCHFYPRTIYNETPAVTTDTIYRGRMLTDVLSPRDVVAGFHNSLTLLSAELEGRSFGGGVLELVPSEVGRLMLVKAPAIGDELSRLDKIVRDAGADGAAAAESLVWETDLLLQKQKVGLTADVLDRLRDGWHALQARRLARSERSSS